MITKDGAATVEKDNATYPDPVYVVHHKKIRRQREKNRKADSFGSKVEKKNLSAMVDSQSTKPSAETYMAGPRKTNHRANSGMGAATVEPRRVNRFVMSKV